MPMIPKPMTDINSESAYEKLKFIPEHYNEIMAAYTDIMEHLKLPVMNDTGGGGSGGDCLHEVAEVTNPCPAYIQFNLSVDIPFTGIHYVYKDNSGDYHVQKIYGYDNNGVSSGLQDILNHLSPRISMGMYSELNEKPILPAPSNSNLVYAAMLVDKTTGEPVEDVNKDTDIDGVSGSETTYTDLTNAYGVKLVLADPHNYSTVPTILGDLLEKIVELRSNTDTSSHRAKLPTPEELLRILQVKCNNYSPTDITAKLDIALLTPEERARVRSNLQMATSGSIPGDTEYMYAINLFCHPNTLNGYHKVSFNCMGGYSKGFIGFNVEGEYGLMDNGCGDSGSVTYRYIALNLTSAVYSESYEYFVLPESYRTYNDTYSAANAGMTVTPHTFKLIQSKEGIDRRL